MRWSASAAPSVLQVSAIVLNKLEDAAVEQDAAEPPHCQQPPLAVAH
eukprot:SAG11_NODE_1315_length_5222_cov_1.990045_2_plen_47_part_00